MTPTNPHPKVEKSTVEVSKHAIRIQTILEDKGYACKTLVQGQIARHVVNGKTFFPLEFPIQVEFADVEPSDKDIEESLLVAILEHIASVHNRNVSGNIYISHCTQS